MKFLSLFTTCFVFSSLWMLDRADAQTILFSDSFNRETGASDVTNNIPDPNGINSDWGTNDNALGGTLVNAWTVGPNRAGGCNQVTDGDLAVTCNGAARYPIDITSLAPSGFTVEFDFSRFHPINPGTGGGFVTVGFGTDPNAGLGSGQFNFNNSDFTFLFQQADPNMVNQGNTQIIQDSVLIDPNNNDQLPGPLDYGDPTIEHSVELTLVPAVNGAYGDSDTINGTITIDNDPNVSHSFSVLGGDFFGNISFSSNGFVHRYIDDLVVTALPVTASDNADFDGDGLVTGLDLLIYQQNVGLTGQTDNSNGDANGDGVVGTADLAVFETQYGAAPPPLTGAIGAVPEPSAFVLLLTGVGFVSTSRRKK